MTHTSRRTTITMAYLSRSTAITTGEINDEIRRLTADATESLDCVSRWVSTVTADVYRAALTIAESGWRSEFPALFDLDGNLIDADLHCGTHGLYWRLNNPTGKQPRTVKAFPTRPATLARKGLAEGTIEADAAATSEGAGARLDDALSVRAVIVRDRSADARPVKVIDSGSGSDASADARPVKVIDSGSGSDASADATTAHRTKVGLTSMIVAKHGDGGYRYVARSDKRGVYYTKRRTNNTVAELAELRDRVRDEMGRTGRGLVSAAGVVADQVIGTINDNAGAA